MGIANTVSDGRGNRPFVLVGKDKMTKIDMGLNGLYTPEVLRQMPKGEMKDGN